MKAILIIGDKTETKVIVKEFETELEFDKYVNDNCRKIIYSSKLTELLECIDEGTEKIFELKVTHETEYVTDDINYNYTYEIK